MMKMCDGCKKIEFCKWVEFASDYNEDLINETKGMLTLNCSHVDNNALQGIEDVLDCKGCVNNVICKFKRPVEDRSLRRKTKKCLNIWCNKYNNGNLDVGSESGIIFENINIEKPMTDMFENVNKLIYPPKETNK